MVSLRSGDAGCALWVAETPQITLEDNDIDEGLPSTDPPCPLSWGDPCLERLSAEPRQSTLGNPASGKGGLLRSR